jgi:hypothetical protein
MGLAALCFNLGGYEQMVERVGMYREGIRHAKPVGSFVNNQIAALCVTHCDETDEEALEFPGPAGVWCVRMAEQLYAPWQGRNVPESYKFAVSAIQHERTGKTLQDHLQSGAFAMGNPDTVIKVLQKYQVAGVDQVLCFMQMGNLAHARIMDSIRLFTNCGKSSRGGVLGGEEESVEAPRGGMAGDHDRCVSLNGAYGVCTRLSRSRRRAMIWSSGRPSRRKACRGMPPERTAMNRTPPPRAVSTSGYQSPT